MSKIDENYHKLLEEILNKGYQYEDPNRKGVIRKELASYKFRHEFKDGFPVITTRKLHYKNVVTELIWFLRGDTNIKYLVDNGCNIWNKDDYNYYLKIFNKEYPHALCKLFNKDEFILKIKENKLNCQDLGDYRLGDLGKVYGHYWRNYDGFDQIKDVIDKMINTPMSSEIIVTARNPNDKDNQALPCCHYGFQIVMRPLDFDYVADYTGLKENIWFDRACKNLEHNDIIKCNNKYYQIFFGPEHDSYEEYIPKYGFGLHWDQRSVDTFLGLPYNIASYATLALILEKITGHKALAIQGDLKKVHLYDNSFEAVKEQLSKDVNKYSKCEAIIGKSLHTTKSINWESVNFANDLDSSDFQLINYESYPALTVEMLERDK